MCVLPMYYVSQFFSLLGKITPATAQSQMKKSASKHIKSWGGFNPGVYMTGIHIVYQSTLWARKNQPKTHFSIPSCVFFSNQWQRCVQG